MDVKFIEGNQLPSNYSAMQPDNLVNQIEKEHAGKTYRLLGISEKNYNTASATGLNKNRIWYGIKAFAKTFFSLGIALLFEKTKAVENWKVFLTGKRKIAIYSLLDDSSTKIEAEKVSKISSPIILSKQNQSSSNEKDSNLQTSNSIAQDSIVVEIAIDGNTSTNKESVKEVLNNQSVTTPLPSIQKDQIPIVEDEILHHEEVVQKNGPEIPHLPIPIQPPPEEPKPISPIIPKSLPQAGRDLKTFVGNSDIPYFLNRKGFPNHSARNCDYNSSAVLYAHTGCSIPLIHPRNKSLHEELTSPENFEAVLHQKIGELTQQISLKKEELAQVKEQNNAKQIEIKKELAIAQQELNELKSLETVDFSEEKKEEPTSVKLLKRELSDKKKEYFALKAQREESKNNDISEIERNAQASAHKLEIKINNLEMRALESSRQTTEAQKQINNAIQLKEQQIVEKKEELKNTLSEGELGNEIGRMQRTLDNLKTAAENQAHLQTGAKILAILRGELEGDLTMEDAQLLRNIVVDDGLIRQHIYNGPADARADINKTKLREALYHSDWRGLRVGGYGHWWVYIRNPDGKTVDEINDSQIYRKQMTIDEIFNKYSNPEEWKKTQITFFQGIKS